MKLINKKALLVSVLIGILIILSIYWYSTTQTQRPNFYMNGIFKTVIIPACPENAVNCNPKYELHLNNGDTYQLLFSSATSLPSDGQFIDVIGNVTYNKEAICGGSNETPHYCQPIGRVTVLGWRPLQPNFNRPQNESYYFFDMNGTIEIFNGSYKLRLNNGTEYQVLFGSPFVNSKFSKPPTAGQYIELMGYVKKCQLNETCNQIVGVSGWRDAPTKFDMNGIFEVLAHPCPSTGCNPWWNALILNNGSYELDYELLFNSTTKLPERGQHIRVIGNVTINHMGICSTNWQETPCQPIGIVTVSNWQQER